MNIQHIGKLTYALEFDESELNNAGISLEDISNEQTAKLLKNSLDITDCNIDGAILELFLGKHSLLIFARLCSDTHYFMFDCLENLLSAVCCIDQNIPSSLYKLSDSYILAIELYHAQMPPSPVYEYGTEVKLHPYKLLHLREQGNEIIYRQAIKQLQSVFHLRRTT